MAKRFKDPLVWLHGTISGFISGGAGAVGTAFGTILVDPKTFNMDQPEKLFKVMLWSFIFSGVAGLVARLQKSPLPELEEETTVFEKD